MEISEGKNLDRECMGATRYPIILCDVGYIKILSELSKVQFFGQFYSTILHNALEFGKDMFRRSHLRMKFIRGDRVVYIYNRYLNHPHYGIWANIGMAERN